MSFTEEERATINFYDNDGREWIKSHNSGRYWGDVFDRYQELLPKGNVLEIGVGGARDAKVLLEMGYQYQGIDISRGLLDMARENEPEATISQQSVYELAYADDSFDGFWASAVLLHLPKNKVGNALKEIHRVTKENGVGFISVKEGDGERIESDGRFFADYQFGEMDSILEAEDLEILETIIWPASKNTTWLIYLVKVKKIIKKSPTELVRDVEAFDWQVFDLHWLLQRPVNLVDVS